jgi:thioredoxin 1
MNDKLRAVALIALLLAIVGGTVWWFLTHREKPAPPAPPIVQKLTTVDPSPSGIPIMVEVGASAGPADMMMSAVMITLKEGFGSRLEVRFENAQANPSLKEKYAVSLLPTQIFYSPDGKEIGRHPGFASEKEILNQLKSLGYDLMAEPKRSEPGEE